MVKLGVPARDSRSGFPLGTRGSGLGGAGGSANVTNSITTYAGELLAALDGSCTIDPISIRQPDFDLAMAYSTSAEILRRRRARGERPIGRKIGFTNRGIWREYGVAAPMWAHVYDSTVTFLDQPAVKLPLASLVQPLLEPEIVLHFVRAPGRCENEDELLSNIDWVAHGFEIVQCHFPDWKFQLADTVADFGLHGALVVGPPRPVLELADPVRELRDCNITLSKERALQSQGTGANALGSPLLAAIYLLDVLHQQPEFEPIQAGEVVTTGTLLSPPPLRHGETWTTELTGIDLPGLRLSAT